MLNVVINQPDAEFPLAWSDCRQGRLYATRDGTPFLKVDGWLVDLKSMSMTLGQGLRFREITGSLEVQL